VPGPLRRSLSARILGVLALLGSLALVLGLLLVAAINAQREAAAKASAAQAALLSAAELERATLDLETGLRGLLVSGDPDFLEPFRDARSTLGEQGSELTGELDRLGLGGERLSEIEAGIDRYASGYVEPQIKLASRDIAAARRIAASGEGKRQTDDLRESFDGLDAEITAQAGAELDQAEAQADAAKRIAALGGVLLLGLLVLLAVAVRRSVLAPVGRLAAVTELIGGGDLGTRISDEGAPDEIGQMNRSFNRMADELEQALVTARESDRLREEFFGLVSHELRTPLTSIVGYVELLSEDAEGSQVLSFAERRRFIGVVDRNSRRLLRLVADLLFVAQLEDGRLRLERRRFDLALVARESIEAAAPSARSGEVTLASAIEGPIHCEGDRDRLAQAIDNLLSNAIKFTAGGGEVGLQVRSQGKVASIEVWDTGVGIPGEEQARLFERFFRASSARSPETPGIGLGLVITRAIIEAHGGALSLESVQGRGSTFRCELPIG